MFSVSEVNRPNIFIGAVALYNFNIERKTCEFGRIIVDHNNTYEEGLGLEATICACKIGFEYFEFQNVFLEVFRENIAAIKTYQKAGFIACSEINGIIKMCLKKRIHD